MCSVIHFIRAVIESTLDTWSVSPVALITLSQPNACKHAFRTVETIFKSASLLSGPHTRAGNHPNRSPVTSADPRLLGALHKTVLGGERICPCFTPCRIALTESTPETVSSAARTLSTRCFFKQETV